MEVNNGGFSQFFYNSSGDLSGELEQAFQAIGATKTAEICKTAVGALGRELPKDTEERQNLLDEMEDDQVDNILSQCDDAFYNYEEDLNSLNHAYVLENKEDFP